jgi:flagellar motor switch protein FliN/FliY
VPEMSTQPQLTEPGAPARGTEPSSKSREEAVENARKLHYRDPLIVRLPVEIDVAVPIRNFRVGDLLALAKGQLVSSEWSRGEDVPMTARGAKLAWAEFESIETKLAVRITRLV